MRRNTDRRLHRARQPQVRDWFIRNGPIRSLSRGVGEIGREFLEIDSEGGFRAGEKARGDF
jgi:hypothetical protein